MRVQTAASPREPRQVGAPRSPPNRSPLPGDVWWSPAPGAPGHRSLFSSLPASPPPPAPLPSLLPRQTLAIGELGQALGGPGRGPTICCRAAVGRDPEARPGGHPSPPALWCHRWERLLTRLRPLPTDTCHRQPDAPSPRRGQPPAQPRPSLPHQPHLLKRCLHSLLNPLHSDCCPGVAALRPLLPSAPWGRAHWPGGPNPAWPSGGCDWLIASSFSKRSPLSHFLSG